MSNESWSEKETREFIDDVGTLAAGAHAFSEGVRYVDDVEYWRWLTSEVVKAPIVDGAPLALTDAEAIQQWVAQRIAEDKGHYVQHVFQNRGAEFDFVRMNQHDPVSFLKGDLWRRATPAEDNMGIDAVRKNVFSGSAESHQIKAGTSDAFKRVDLSKYGPNGPKPADVVDVNEKIHDWRQSEVGQAKISARGDAHPDVRKSFSDDEIERAGRARMKSAEEGNAAPQVSFEGALGEIGRGAMIGAVVGVGTATIANYDRYRRGEIDGATFGNLMLADSARGALTGGSIAAVNIPVQLAAHAIGVGNPVTIPVMIVFSAAIRNVIDPMFGKGRYADELRDLQISTDVSHAVAGFVTTCQRSFEMQRPLFEEMARLERRGRVLNQFSDHTDALLDAAIDEI